MTTRIIISGLFALLFCHPVMTQQQQAARQPMPEKCEVEARERGAPEYKIGRAWATGTEPVETYLLISIQPQEFTKAKIVALAHQLRKDFCKETRFGAILFDDYDASRQITYLSNTRHLEKAQRGFYHLARDKKEEYIQFSTARGHPRDEIKIDLTKE